MTAPDHSQVSASDPRATVFVSANAGSGKTSTLVKRVARLLLAGARPEAILCVTYTKAGAAEMQRRLFQDLGDWAVMDDDPLKLALAKIDEGDRELPKARALFARALETPGGLKIQTIHGFCERLLRRFPLEAGVSPGFTVLEDQLAADISAEARDGVARFGLDHELSDIAAAYAHFSVQLDWQSFNAMFAAFESRRAALGSYCAGCRGPGGFEGDVWRRCGFESPTTSEAVAQEGVARIRWGRWRGAAEALTRGSKADQERGRAMQAITPDSTFDEIWPIFLTQAAEPRARLGTQAIDPKTLAWLSEEQGRHHETHQRRRMARMAEDTVQALHLASAYGGAYETAKAGRGGLDFGDLVARAIALLTVKADAAWVLFKLDGGIDHVLLDEAQDTAPEQWEILRQLTAEFFVGAGAGADDRTVFAVGDEKQSIFSFQGARPERLARETRDFAARAANGRFKEVKLHESWRSAPEILAFVDTVFQSPDALAGLRSAPADTIAGFPITHRALRDPGGCVELWPLEQGGVASDPDPWAPVDAESSESAGRRLASRIAREIGAMVTRGDAVMDRATRILRPCRPGDVMILVRRRNALFHEIIRALKREGVAVGGADRLALSEHPVFEDLMALARFALFPGDDLSLACLLRAPFCDIDEAGLFDLAYQREGTLWRTLGRRARERPAWMAALAFLAWARDEAPRRAPFDFFNLALNRLDEAGRSMRQRLLTRLGMEAADALEAFLGAVLTAEAAGARDLETLVARLAASEIEIKREQEHADQTGGGEVRVMTAHGAKGLEAPIVILPDTTTRATDRGGPLLEIDGDAFLWAPRRADDCALSAQARQARERANEQESLRLLYVALTRARDRLIITGVESLPRFFDRSWRHYAQQGFDQLPLSAFTLSDGAEAWRYGPTPTFAGPATEVASAPPPLPAWTRGLAPPERGSSGYASPSGLGEADKGSAPSPLARVGGLGRYRRGDIIHRLLQLLPDIPAPARPEAATIVLSREVDLTDAQRAEMAGAALTVLADPRFADVFGPGSRPEVALAGAGDRLPPEIAISGRVDRLLVEADRVLVVDFKTNRPSPDRIEDADPDYVLQMAVYAAVLGEIFPGRRIEAALVWTDGPKLMAVPQSLMTAALEALAARTAVGAAG